MFTKTQEKILSYLIANPEQPPTIRGIAKKLNKSYPLVYNNIAKLEKSKLITKQSVPPAQIIKLNEFTPVEILIDIELKRKNEFLKKNTEIKLMLKDLISSSKNPFFIILIFGSYAKGAQTPKSDLDLLIITKEKKEIVELEKTLDNIYTKIKKAPHFIDADDFEEMARNTKKFNIGNEAIKHHIILYGVEQYYQLLKNIYKK